MDPEKYGLSTVKSLDIAGAYEFDEIVVWRDAETGRMYVGHDSGCSCPVPFDHIGRNDLTAVSSPADIDRFVRETWGDSFRFGEYGRFTDVDAAIAELVGGVW